MSKRCQDVTSSIDEKGLFMQKRNSVAGFSLLLLFVVLMLLSGSITAATITVNSVLDEDDILNCADEDCTLREAFADAVSGDTIVIPNLGVYTLATTSYIYIGNKSLTVIGDGVDQTVIDGGSGGTNGIFYTAGTSSVTFQDMTLQNGRRSSGACVYNTASGVLTLHNMKMTGCVATSSGGAVFSSSTVGKIFLTGTQYYDSNQAGATGSGGAIYISHSTQAEELTISDLTLTNNVAGYQGGGLASNNNNALPPIKISNAIISGNRLNAPTGMTWIRGGGIQSGGDIELDGVLVDDNGSQDSNADWCYGGGIYANKSLVISNSTITNNKTGCTSTNSDGGGAYAASSGTTYSITNSTIAGNAAGVGSATGGQGGGVYIAGEPTFTNSTISGNTAKESGGGVYAYSATFINSTITGNVAQTSFGGALQASTSAGRFCTFKGSTVYGNSAPLNSTTGGIYCRDMNLSMTVLANNTKSGSVVDNCYYSSTINSSGYNFDDGIDCGLSGVGDITNGGDPQLQALANYGYIGPNVVTTLKPLASSPLIDQVPATGSPCEDVDLAGIDQRGFTRPMDGDADDISKCDIGAVEYDTYSVQVIVHGGGSVTGSGDSSMLCDSNSGGCLEAYELGNTPVYTAVADSGYVLSSWAGSDGASCIGSQCSPTIDASKQYIANFVPSTNPQILGVSVNNSAFGRVSSNYGGISCINTDPDLNSCSVPLKLDESVTLTAIPAAGYQFDNWSGDCPATPETCVLTMDTAKSVTANFSIKQYSLSVLLSPAGMGSVTSSSPKPSPAINCPSSVCSVNNLLVDEAVTLDVTPPGGYTFLGWSGACYGNAACNLTINDDKVVTAVFTPIEMQLNVDVIGDVGGVVTSSDNPVTMNCSDVCVEPYAKDSLVTLTATANADYTFSAWGGDAAACADAITCDVTMSSIKNVTATFTLNTYTLSIVKAGDLVGGSIVSHDGLISCGGDCSESYAAGRVVTLSVSGSGTFEGWSGAGCSGTWICNVTLDQSHTVTATFSGSTPVEEPDPDFGQTYTVTRTDDPIPDGCALSDCSLREAVAAANANPGRDKIQLGEATYTLTGVEGEDGNATGDLDIGDSEFIKGAGATLTTITITPNTDRILHFAADAGGLSVIKGVTFTGGRTSAGGGGCILASRGSLELRDVVITGCYSTGAYSTDPCDGNGGGICKERESTVSYTDKLTIKDSKIYGNSTSRDGGGIYSEAHAVSIGDSEIYNNTAGTYGGGFSSINTTGNVAVDIVDTLIANNQASSYGGGVSIRNGDSVANIKGSLFKGNQLTSGLSKGGGYYAHTGESRIANTTFTQNTSASGTAMYIDNYSTPNPTFVKPGPSCTINNVTIYDNDGAGKAIYKELYDVPSDFPCFIGNTVIVGNSGGNCDDSAGVIVMTGNNLVENNDNCDLINGFNGDVVVTPEEVASLFKPLANYGGATESLEPLSTASKVVDAANDSVCGVSPVNGSDQRGHSRPINANGASDTGECDIGAVELNPYELTVIISGTGIVSSDLGSINCPDVNCTGFYNMGQPVVLTAATVAGSGYIFNGWSGACTNSSGPCLVTMGAAKSVTANFVLDTSTYTLSVNAIGIGGTVSSSPAGVNCSNTSCNVDFSNNTDVTLTAAPQMGFEFQGWGGECTGKGSCVVTMNMARAVTATFITEVNTVTLTVKGYGAVDADYDSLDCAAKTECSATFADGTTITLTPTAQPGFYIDEWQGACAGQGTGNCVITVNGDLDITASFPTYRIDGVFMNSEHGAKEATYPDRDYYPGNDGVTGVSRAHIDLEFNNYPRGECEHCHDFTFDPLSPPLWPMTFTAYSSKEEKVDFCGNCHTDNDPDANGTDGDTPYDYSFKGPSAFKKSVHYTRNLSWPGGEYGSDYPPMPPEGAGACINCHSPHAHKYSSSYASLPDGIDPASIPFPKQLVELTDINNNETDLSGTNFPESWPNVNGRDPDDAEDICYTCHDGDPVVNKSLSAYNTYMKYGEAPFAGESSIKESFDLGLVMVGGLKAHSNHPVMDSAQIAIAGEFNTTTISIVPSVTFDFPKHKGAIFKTECTTCHNPHLVSGTWDDIASDVEATPVVLPGVSEDWPNPAIPGYVPGEAWGDEPDEKVNALLVRMARDNKDARGTGGWAFNVARGYSVGAGSEDFLIPPHERLDTRRTSPVTFDQAAVYQPPYGGLGPDQGLQPDGDQLPDFITFCLDCHQNNLKNGPVYWGAGWPYDPSLQTADWYNIYDKTYKREPHGFDPAGVTPNVCGDSGNPSDPNPYSCVAGESPCIDIKSTHLDESDPWSGKPQGAGYSTWSLPPYSMADRAAGINYVLVCTDCHEPHASERQNLIRTHINGNRVDDNTFHNICTSCHYDWAGGMTSGIGEDAACGSGTPNASGCESCHKNVSIHRLGSNGYGIGSNHVALADPDTWSSGTTYDVEACIDIEPQDATPEPIGLWTLDRLDNSNKVTAKDESANDAHVIYTKGTILNGIIDTRNGGNFRTKRRECHDMVRPSVDATKAVAFSYEGKIKYVPGAVTNAVDPEDSIEMSLIDYTLDGAGANWAVRLSNRCCTADVGGDGIADGDPSGDMYLQVMINVWDQDQVNPWRIAYSKIAMPERAEGFSGLDSVAATFDSTDTEAALRVYINGQDVTDGIGGVWVHDPAVYNPSVANMYEQPVGMHINTTRFEDDWVVDDPSGAPDGNKIATWDSVGGTNLNPYIHFGVDATVCRPFCDNVEGKHNFWGFMGSQRIFNIALTPDEVCSNYLKKPADTPWDTAIYMDKIAADCSP